MSLLGFFTGVDLEEEQARSDKADAQLQSLNEASRDSGKITQEEFDRRSANNIPTDVAMEVEGAFESGLKDGISNVKGTIGGAISFPFKLVPWQLWLVAGAALFLYMGGGAMLRGILKKS